MKKLVPIPEVNVSSASVTDVAAVADFTLFNISIRLYLLFVSNYVALAQYASVCNRSHFHLSSSLSTLSAHAAKRFAIGAIAKLISITS